MDASIVIDAAIVIASIPSTNHSKQKYEEKLFPLHNYIILKEICMSILWVFAWVYREGNFLGWKENKHSDLLIT